MSKRNMLHKSRNTEKDRAIFDLNLDGDFT